MAIKPMLTADTVHAVVVDTRTPVGVGQLVKDMFVNRGKAMALEREINRYEAKYPNMVAWIESYRIHDGKLVETKRYANGTDIGTAKLTEEIVLLCRERHRLGEPTKRLAAEFGISRQAMSDALMGRSWKNVA